MLSVKLEVEKKPPDKKAETVATDRFKVVKAEYVGGTRMIKRFIIQATVSNNK